MKTFITPVTTGAMVFATGALVFATGALVFAIAVLDLAADICCGEDGGCVLNTHSRSHVSM